MGTWIEIRRWVYGYRSITVVPRVGTWIEIDFAKDTREAAQVVPRVGTWIEILLRYHPLESFVSSPAWGRGLKFFYAKI